MRKMLVVLAALLLAATSAQAGYVVSLESGGLASVNAPGTYTISMMMEGDGLPNEFGTTGWVGAQAKIAALPVGWTVVGPVVYNTVDFDSSQSAGTSVTGVIGILADIMAIDPENLIGYTTVKKQLLTFTLNATTPGELKLTDVQAVDFDNVNLAFNTIYPGADLSVASFVVTPEPATALLLIGALPFLRRRRA